MVQARWVPGRGIPVHPAKARLRLIYGIYRIVWFIRPFDWNILRIYQDLRYWDPGPDPRSDPDPDPGPDPGPDPRPDWSSDRPQESYILNIPGFKALVLASDILSWSRPRIG